jgi:hypothetical protein
MTLGMVYRQLDIRRLRRRRRGRGLLLIGRDQRIHMLWLNGGRLRATSLDQVSNLNPAVRIKNRCQPFFLLVLIPRHIGRGKHAGDLRKYTNLVNGVDIGDDVRVGLFVFEEKRAQVWLAALHHFFYSRDDLGITNDNCLVETGE